METLDLTTGTLNPKVILFDLDGTLLDTSKDLRTALNQIQHQYQVRLWSLDEVQQGIGHGIEALVRLALPQLENHDKAIQQFKEFYHIYFDDQTHPYPEIPRLLKALKLQGFKLGVVSNKADIYTQRLIQHHFPNQFDVVIGSTNELPKKPHPAMIELALSKLKVLASSAIYIGDSEVDVHSATQAGLTYLCVTWGYRSPSKLMQIKGMRLVGSSEDCLKVLGCV